MLFRRTVLAGLTALVLSPIAAFAAELPDLKGKTVVVVTENAYPPLQFVDPKTGKQIGWEYDAMNEIAKRLNFKVEYQNTSWDAMIQAVSDNQYNIGMTGITIKDDRKAKVDFSDPYMRSQQFMLVRGDETGLPTPRPSAPSMTAWSARSRAPRPSTPPSTRSSTATSRTRASSCSRPSAPPYRRSRPATSMSC
jgi:ABC-type amino acid transport substrate-binding protein